MSHQEPSEHKVCIRMWWKNEADCCCHNPHSGCSINPSPQSKEERECEHRTLTISNPTYCLSCGAYGVQPTPTKSDERTLLEKLQDPEVIRKAAERANEDQRRTVEMASGKSGWEGLGRKVAQEVEAEWQMGGLSDGLYFDYAMEVARRLTSSALKEQEKELKPYLTHLDNCNERWEIDDEKCSCGLESALTQSQPKEGKV